MTQMIQIKKLLVSTIFILSFFTLPAQNSDKVTLTRVTSDSLKTYLERSSGFKVYFEEYNENEHFTLTLSQNSSELLSDLRSQLTQYRYVITLKDNNLYILKNTPLISEISGDFFMKEVNKESNNMVMNALLTTEDNVASTENKIYTVGNPSVREIKKTAIITGYIRSIATGEPVIDAGVMIESRNISALSDENGFYRIVVPTGLINMTLKAYGMKDTHLTVEVFENGVLDINMSDIIYSLVGATISAESTSSVRSTKMGIEKIRIDRIKHIPSIFGEADVLKVVLTLPGVKTVGESASGFNVRGGATDQNLILFNGGTVYNPTHLFGIFSAFNPDVVNDIELYKSSIPAKYGGRISSVLEVNSRTGNANKVTGSAGIGILTSKFHIEGPILSDKTTFIAGLRTSYSNWILRLLPENSGYNGGAANFLDGTLGFNHRFNDKNSIQIFGYYSNDGFKFSSDTSYNYQSFNASVKWRSIVNDNMNFTFTSGVDQYRHYIQETGNPINAYRMSFNINQYYAKIDFNNLISDKNSINYGVNTLFYDTYPGKYHPVGESSLVVPIDLESEKGVEAAIYISDTWNITSKFALDLGIRYSFYSAIGPKKYYKYTGPIRDQASIIDTVIVGNGKFIQPYHGPEFRISVKYDITNDLIFKAGFNTMQQYIHMISNTVAAAPTDTWKLSDYNIKPQKGWQAAAGLFKIFNINNNQVELSIEGYYKKMLNYLDYRSGAQINMNHYLERDVLETTGKAYGVELMLKKELGKLNGWIGYTYSRTMLKEQGEKEIYSINRGEWYPAAYDKPHDFKLVANYKFTHRFSMSLNVDYATGRPITVPIRIYRYLNGYRLQYSDRNLYRVPDYFRVDFAINIEPSHYLKKLTYSSVTIGIYNLTGRQNAFSVFYETNKGKEIRGYKLSIFGAPIPYVTYNLKF